MNCRPPLREVPDGAKWPQGWTAFFTQLFEAVGWVKGWSYKFPNLDFPSVPANSQSAGIEVPIPGVRAGDSVTVTPFADTVGLIFKGVVTSDDKVTIYALNLTAGAVNPVAMQYRVVVIQN